MGKLLLGVACIILVAEAAIGVGVSSGATSGSAYPGVYVINPQQFSSIEAAVSAVGTGNATLLVSSNQNVNSDLIVPQNIHLSIIQDGRFTIMNGKSLRIHGGLSAPPRQLFYGDGLVLFGEGSDREVRPEWWGGDNRGVADSSVAISRAIAALLKVRGGIIRFAPGGYYRANIEIPNGQDWLSGLKLQGGGIGQTALAAFDPGKPTVNYVCKDNKNVKIYIEGLSITGSGPSQSSDIVSLHGSGTNAGRVYGYIRDCYVKGNNQNGNVISIRYGLNFSLRDIMTDSGLWSLYIKDSSNCSIENFHAMYDVTNGIFIDGGGEHSFIRCRIEDKLRSPSGITVAVRLLNTIGNTFIGVSSEGKSGINYSMLMQGTGSGSTGSCSLNRFLGCQFAAPSDSTSPGLATLRMEGNCNNNYFANCLIQKADLFNRASHAVILTDYAFNGRFPSRNRMTSCVLYWDNDPSGSLNGVSVSGTGNRLELTCSTTQDTRVFGTIRNVTAADTVSSAETGMTFTNSNAKETTILSLPHPGPGLEFTFTAISAPLLVAPSSKEQIRVGSPRRILIVPPGSSATLRCIAPTWVIVASHGPLNFE